MIFAGPGTFWTDLKSFQDIGASKLLDPAGGRDAWARSKNTTAPLSLCTHNEYRGEGAGFDPFSPLTIISIPSASGCPWYSPGRLSEIIVIPIPR